MMWFSFANLSTWAMALSLALHLAAGLILGLLYFQGVWWNARRFLSSSRLITTIAFGFGRFALLGALLLPASLEGAPPLLAITLGMLIVRPIVIRRVREPMS